MTAQELEAYVDASAAALGLTLGESRPEVLRYFALASGFADLVQAVPLTSEDETSMAFIPTCPVRSSGDTA